MKYIRYQSADDAFSNNATSPRSLWLNYSLRLFMVAGVFLLIKSLTGCIYFKEVSTNNPKTEDISKELSVEKTIIIHTITDTYIWNNVFIDGDSLRGNVSSQRYESIKISEPITGPAKYPRYRTKLGQQRVLNEVHLYVRPESQLSFQKNSIGIKDIAKCKIYDTATGKTIIVWVFGAAFVFLSAVLAIFLVMILIAIMFGGGSCPYIYTNTETGYTFAGEIYSGAIYAPLERDDYLNLPRLVPENGKYKLIISNELKEIQNTNLTELLVLDHNSDTEVLIDKYGSYQTSAQVIQAVKSVNSAGEDISGFLNLRDSVSYCGMLPGKDMPLAEEIVMSYVLPDNIKQAKIFIRARNSVWLDKIYLEYNQMLGSYRDNWIRKQNKADPEELRLWSLNQKIPLSVYVFRNGQWQFCDFFNPAGPMALKDDVLSIDLTGTDPGSLQLKLEYGTNFWEIDYVGLDFTLNTPVKITPVLISTAITEKDDEVADMLKYDDLKYYSQPEENMFANLTFDVPPGEGSDRTVILHSKGYYNINDETRGIPKLGKLRSIREPGQFLEYSRQLMQSAYQDLLAKK